MTKEKEIVILSGFIGFTIGVCVMMLVNTDTKSNCYEIIQDIEMKVCEECWYEVFDMGEEYEEVQDYVTWE